MVRAPADVANSDAPPVRTLELFGLPGSGKNLVSRAAMRVLQPEGWHVAPMKGLTVAFTAGAPDVDDGLAEIVGNQARRLVADGLRPPWLIDYVRYSAQVLLASREWRRQTAGRVFLDESLLHHFGPEVAAFLRSGPDASTVAGLLGRECIALLVTADRNDVLTNLESRRGIATHWDWASGYGSRLYEFLDASEDRINELAALLTIYGVPILNLHVNPDSTIDTLSGTLIEQLHRGEAALDSRAGRG